MKAKDAVESEWERQRQSATLQLVADEAITAPNCSLVFAGADKLPAHIYPRRAVDGRSMVLSGYVVGIPSHHWFPP